ncbi:MAG: hypothetical protein ACI88H_002092 [Cocleimonas sp.]|jgi:hypothetical protein
MKNKTYQMTTISRVQTATLANNSGKKRLTEQTGSINKLLLILIVGGLGYSAFIAKNKGLISFDKTQNFVSNLSNKVSGSLNTNSNDYTGYGVQLVATKQLDQAKGIMNDFARDGYSAFVVASEAKGRTLYKVRLGPYSHKPEAVAIQDKVVRRYPNSPYVKSSLVIYKPN